MKIEKRKIGISILLSIVTCGIYGIVWAVCLVRDAVRIKDMNDDGILEILLVILFPPVGFYLTEKKLSDGCQAAGIQHDNNAILYVIFACFGFSIVNYCLMQSAMNNIADLFENAPPQQPYGGAPQQQPYGTPPQQPYGAPQQQPYGAPQQPYGSPQQPYSAPQQPCDTPQQQPYGTPQQ